MSLNDYPKQFWHFLIKTKGQRKEKIINDLSFEQLNETIIKPWSENNELSLLGLYITDKKQIEKISIVQTAEALKFYSQQNSKRLKNMASQGVLLVLDDKSAPFSDGTDYTNELLFSNQKALKIQKKIIDNMSNIELFISHSSDDAHIAKQLIQTIEMALNLPSHELIRCTSVNGYKLSFGETTNSTLKNEISGCRIVIGIMSSKSMKSAWVNHELGACWALSKSTKIIITSDVNFNDIKGPLRDINMLKANDSDDIMQLLDEITQELGWNPKSNSRLHEAAEQFINLFSK